MTASFESMGDMFLELVPKYKSKTYRNLVVTFPADDGIGAHMRSISDRRCTRRVESYVIPGELERGKTSMRFGVKKEGHGYHGERGDFCLIGGTLNKGHPHLFYRQVELIGGLHYDMAIVDEVRRVKGPVKRITIMAAGANAFALRGNSNEKLYPQLRSYYLAS
jgi:hypothetical protein